MSPDILVMSENNLAQSPRGVFRISIHINTPKKIFIWNISNTKYPFIYNFPFKPFWNYSEIRQTENIRYLNWGKFMIFQEHIFSFNSVQQDILTEWTSLLSWIFFHTASTLRMEETRCCSLESRIFLCSCLIDYLKKMLVGSGLPLCIFLFIKCSVCAGLTPRRHKGADPAVLMQQGEFRLSRLHVDFSLSPHFLSYYFKERSPESQSL